MKILTIIPDYPPFFVGGTSVHTYELNNFLASKDFEPWVLTFWENPKKINVELSVENGVHIVRVPRPDSNIGGYNEQFLSQNRSITQGLHWLCENNLKDFNLIVLHSYFLAEASIYAKNLFKVPLVYHAHTLFSNFTDVKQKEKYKIINDYEKRICLEANKVIVVSEYLKNLLSEKLDLDSSDMVVITKGVDLNKYNSIHYTHIIKDYKKIVYAGRISFEKGIETLIKALKIVRDTYEEKVMLFIIGSASDEMYLTSLKKLIRELQLERSVMFLGFKNSDDIIAEYKSSDLTVVPSYAETFGKVAIEAMAAKVPVIVSDIGGLGPIITHGINGLKFKTGDEVDLAKNILTILCDSVFANKLKEAAFSEVTKRYRWEQILDQTIQIYVEVTRYENISSFPPS